MNIKNCLHISSNQFPGLEKSHFTKKTWIELSKGFDSYHIVARAYSNKFEYYNEGNIHLHLVPSLGTKARSFMLSSFFIFYLINKYKITHLLAQSPILGGVTAALASKLFRIPLMCEVHGEEYFRYFKRTRIIDIIFSLMAKFSFATSKKVRSLNSKMTEKLLLNGITNIIEIPNRVDLSLFKKQKKQFNPNKPLRLISIGRFVREKNYLSLIEALGRSKLDFHLTLIGGGPLKKQYENLIQQLNIANRITLIDWIEQEEIVDLVTFSDIYIQYSVSEGFPRTILEAMAMKMPIISTDVGSISGIIRNDINGILIPSNSGEDLINSISNLVQNGSFSQTIANNGYEDAKNKYEWNRVFALYRNELTNMKY